MDNYRPMPLSRVVEILPDNKVIFDSNEVIEVSYVVVLIGSSPDLTFLEPELLSNLGILKNVDIGRGNPVDIDLFSNEAVDVPGVYAMGPLVGDNFVRFLQGGAVAIMRDILRKEKKQK